MEALMDDQVNRPALRDVIDALDSSVRDLASGAVSDARSVQAEARRMLADYDRARTGLRGPTPPGSSLKPMTLPWSISRPTRARG